MRAQLSDYTTAVYRLQLPTERPRDGYFPATSLAENTGVGGVSIIDRTRTGIVDAVRGGRFGNHFADLIQPIQGFWENNHHLNIPFQWAIREPPSIPRRRR